MPNLGPMELLIIFGIALLLFGGSRLAGVGKGTGRAIREFKEETRGLRDADKEKEEAAKAEAARQAAAAQQQTPAIQAAPTVNPAAPYTPQQGYTQNQQGAVNQQPYVQQTPAGQYDQAVDAEIVDRPNN